MARIKFTTAFACCPGEETGGPSDALSRCHGAKKLAEVYRQDLGEEPVLTCSMGGIIAVNAASNLSDLYYRTE